MEEIPIPYKDANGNISTFRIDTDGLFLLSLIKLVFWALLTGWGYHGVKTFKPVIKEIYH